VDLLVQFPKPTIAAVDGLAFGGGSTMAAACDMRVVSTRATFSFALGKLGLTPEWGSSYLLWRQIGWSRVLDLFLTGRTVDADEAYRLGLADRVVDPSEIEAVTQALADAMASVPPGTAEATKRALWSSLEAPDLAAARTIELRTLGERGQAMRAMRSAPPS
jgi:enoyl-CoA hydratase/carnithine racemase